MVNPRILATLALTTWVAWGALPPPELPQGVGVNIHFTRGHTRDLDLIAAAGFRFVRMDFSWAGTERARGEYDWGDYEELTRNLEQRGLHALYILDYSNRLYEEDVVTRDPVFGRESRSPAAPRHPESVAAFARWAAAAARHFKGRPILWEVWNEPNIGFWRPKPDVNEYVTLLRATLEAVRQADPQATIVAPASSGFPWDFLETLCAAPGVLDRLDGISVHPYRSRGPETVADDYVRLRALIEEHTAAGNPRLPILSGEWGYSSARGGVSTELQAAYAARQQLVNLWQGVPLSIWYDWKNDGTDPDEREHHFGTVTHDLEPKPAYLAIQTLTRELKGCWVVRRLAEARGDDYLLLCGASAVEPKLVAWTTGKPRRLALPREITAPSELAGIDGRGRPLASLTENGAVVLELTGQPQYLTLRTPTARVKLAMAWEIDPAMATRVIAGGPEAVLVPLHVRNPFEHAVEIETELAMPDATPAVERLHLSPGEKASRSLPARLVRRDRERIKVTVQLRCYRVTGSERTLIASDSEARTLVVANPLLIEAAPAENGLRVTLDNPAGQPFRGRLKMDGLAADVPIEFRQGQVRETAVLDGPLPSATSLRLLLEPGGHAIAAQALNRWEALPVTGLVAALDGDAQVPAQASLVLTNPPPAPEPPATRAYRLDYEFDPGWRFVRCAIPPDRAPVAVPVQAKRLGLWIRGDGSGNALRIRLGDDAGQTFQLNGPRLDWREWRWVTFDLQNWGDYGHWGGANDGVVRGPLRFDTPLLIDGTRTKCAGTIYFTPPSIEVP